MAAHRAPAHAVRGHRAVQQRRPLRRSAARAGDGVRPGREGHRHRPARPHQRRVGSRRLARRPRPPAGAVRKLTANNRRALAMLALLFTVLAGLHFSGFALPVLLSAAVVVAFVCWALPWLGVRWLDDIILGVRSWYWAPDEGRFH